MRSTALVAAALSAILAQALAAQSALRFGKYVQRITAMAQTAAM